MTDHDDRLTAAGFDLDTMTVHQADVVRGLSAEEVTTLLSIRQRVDEAGPDVEGHNVVIGGALW